MWSLANYPFKNTRIGRATIRIFTPIKFSFDSIRKLAAIPTNYSGCNKFKCLRWLASRMTFLPYAHNPFVKLHSF